MEKEKEKKPHKPHILVLPYPSQGHVNPLLQFSKRLIHKGAKVTLAATRSISNSFHGDSGSIPIHTISDGYDQGGLAHAESPGVYLERFQEVGSRTLTKLIEKLNTSGCPVDCVVYDAFLPWALDVAKDFGLAGAVFFTQSCAVNNIYYHLHLGLLKLPLSEGEAVNIPGLFFPLQACEFPSFVYVYGSYPAFFDMLVNQFSNIDKADWVFCNSFYKLEEKVVDWMEKRCPLKTIGPTLPSAYLDKRLQDDKDYGLAMFKPSTGRIMEWMDSKPVGSVVYASFGSLAVLEAEQMEELAWGLRSSNAYFLFVVREASEAAKLPQFFAEETAEKGLIVSWCSQLEVLAHKATGCFVTHGGWNSILEGLSSGVAMVVFPQWSDQATNAKLVEDVWETGVRAAADEKGIVRRQVLQNCIREVMEGERGEKIKKNAMKWMNLAKEAADEGGTSDKCMDEFLDKLSV